MKPGGALREEALKVAPILDQRIEEARQDKQTLRVKTGRNHCDQVASRGEGYSPARSA